MGNVQIQYNYMLSPVAWTIVKERCNRCLRSRSSLASSSRSRLIARASRAKENIRKACGEGSKPYKRFPFSKRQTQPKKQQKQY